MQEKVEALIKDVVCELTEDWDLDELEITADTALCAEAGFESLDIVQLVVLIEKKLEKPGIPFEQLFMKDGQYIDDITIKELSSFVLTKVNSQF